VEIVKVDESVYVALAESQEGLQDGEVECLTGRDLSEYDYISIGKKAFVLVNVKLALVTRLENMSINHVE
jgi:hypothetical protein